MTRAGSGIDIGVTFCDRVDREAGLLSRAEKEWECIGRKEPFFGVCTDKAYLNEFRDKEAENRFWRSGERHVEAVFRFVSGHLDPGFSPKRALDFGCGVGRVLIPMSGRCADILGVDVSAPMLEVARKQLDTRSIGNVSVARVFSGAIPGEDSFDFIHSYIVFQHITPSRGYRILDQLLSRLSPGGIGVLHFTFDNYKRNKLLHRLHALPVFKQLGNLLSGRPANEPIMQMHEYDMNEVLSRISAIADGEVHAELTDHGVLGAVLYFRKT